MKKHLLITEKKTLKAQYHFLGGMHFKMMEHLLSILGKMPLEECGN